MTPATERGKAPRVVKYGGAALSPENLPKALEDARRGERPLVLVVSARAGVTDLLQACLKPPFRMVRHVETLEQLRRLHPGLPPEGEREHDGLASDLKELRKAGRTTNALSDRLLARGERLAAHWFAGELRRQGVPAVALQADEIGLRTDGPKGEGRLLLEPSARPVRTRILRELELGRVPVVTGFLARSSSGSVTTLGRGGSDYSATAIGYCIGASRVELVKDPFELLTADPRHVPGARPILSISFDEADELAQFGAKVLHPRTIEPARKGAFEVIVRSLSDPGRQTRVSPEPGPQPVRALALLSPIALLILRVSGGRQRRGVISEASELLSGAGVNVVALFTSSAQLCIAVEGPQAARSVRALRRFVEEEGATLEGPHSAALVTAIGQGILGDLGEFPPEAGSLVLGASATARALSLAVPERRAPDVLRELHLRLVEKPSGSGETP